MQDFNSIIEAVTRLEEKVISLAKSVEDFRQAFYANKAKPGWFPVVSIVCASIFSWLTFLTWAIIKIGRPG
jgi:hypothetical protein